MRQQPSTPKFCVVMLGDRIVAAHRDQLATVIEWLWRSRQELLGAWGDWLRSLEEPPKARILLGNSSLFNEETAWQIGRLLNARPVLAPHEYEARVVNIVSADTVMTFPCADHAARHYNVTPQRVNRKLRTLGVDRQGRVWI